LKSFKSAESRGREMGAQAGELVSVHDGGDESVRTDQHPLTVRQTIGPLEFALDVGEVAECADRVDL
jgi:hypothetical protein